jgi:hypothetical protein
LASEIAGAVTFFARSANTTGKSSGCTIDDEHLPGVVAALGIFERGQLVERAQRPIPKSLRCR